MSPRDTISQKAILQTRQVLLDTLGGRLRARLEERGTDLHCLDRRPEFLKEKVAKTTRIVHGGLLDIESLHRAMEGIEIAYYLAHSMVAKGDFQEQDPRAAQNFANAAQKAGVKRIIYLGEPSDIASAITWLLNPAQSWVTGQVIGIDGGHGTLKNTG